MGQDIYKSINLAALRCLGRREYGIAELTQHLCHKGFPSKTVAEVVKQLQNEGAISDQRFAESYIRARIARGFGPQRVVNELRQKGIADEVIDFSLSDIEDQEMTDWSGLAARVREKRFGVNAPATVQDKAKQWRYLQYKGFTSEQIHSLFND
ncbi:MAG: recombination regulator RecX [Gammaproteobacteria bacterium]|nr:recombination regulator RecX [Gammaproteobacteria bacterium]